MIDYFAGRRNEKRTALLKDLAAKFVGMEAGPQSLITVTKLEMSADGKNANIFVSVLPENAEPHALDFLKRQRSALKDFVRKNSRLRAIPFFDFKIDVGEKNRQNVDRLLSK